jgi:CubicO group peptidase (beta-lactamase class C family)
MDRARVRCNDDVRTRIETAVWVARAAVSAPASVARLTPSGTAPAPLAAISADHAAAPRFKLGRRAVDFVERSRPRGGFAATAVAEWFRSREAHAVKHHLFSRISGLLLAALVAVLLVLPTGTALAGNGTAAPAAAKSKYAATIEDGRAAAKALLKQTGAASVSVALVSGNKVVWQQGFGCADKATSAAPQAGTAYGLGSVSKMLATVAVMKLVDRGVISLDTPVYRYVPEFTMLSPDYRQITVRMLLDHSSGMPGSEYADCIGTEYLPGYVDRMMHTLAISRLKTTPGYMSVYCNDGFTMIEKLIPAVTGKSFARFVTDEVLTPLGMSDTKYPPTRFARCYTGSVANPQEMVNTLASGGAYSTPSDMAKLAVMFMNGGAYNGRRILSGASVNEMGRDQTLRGYNPAPSDATRYGLGWDTVTEPGLKAVGITGWCKGGDSNDYHAAFTVAPKDKVAAIVTGVAPLSSVYCEDLGQRVLLHALVDKGQLRRMPAPLPQTPPRVKQATAAQLAAITGYWGMSGALLRVAAAPGDGQGLTISTLSPNGWSAPSPEMRLRKDGRFYAKGNPKSLRVLKAGNRTYLVQNGPAGYGHYTDDLLALQKLEAGEALSAAWRNRVGHSWLVVNEDSSSSAVATNGGPVLELGDTPGLPGYVTVTSPSYGIEPVDPSRSDSTAFMFLQIPGMGSRDLNDTVVWSHGAEEWLSFGSAIYRPMATVPALVAGANAVSFGTQGYAEWRKLPNGGQVSIEHASAWHLFNGAMEIVGSGTISAATASAPSAGCYLLLYGAAGSNADVTAP